MSALAVLELARSHGVSLSKSGTTLRCEALPGGMTAELRAALTTHKVEILALLNDAPTDAALLHLRYLAESSGIDWRTIEALVDPEAMAECNTDEQRRAYVRLLDDRAHVEAGIPPSHWTHRAHCAGCGDVWLWAPLNVLGCLWCRNRKNGWPIPRRPSAAHESTHNGVVSTCGFHKP